MDPTLTVMGILGSLLVLCIGTILQGVILSRLTRLEDKLDQKVNKDDCVASRENCKESLCKFTSEDVKLWGTFNKHSHEGLPAESRVISRA